MLKILCHCLKSLNTIRIQLEPSIILLTSHRHKLPSSLNLVLPQAHNFNQVPLRTSHHLSESAPLNPLIDSFDLSGYEIVLEIPLEHLVSRVVCEELECFWKIKIREGLAQGPSCLKLF